MVSNRSIINFLLVSLIFLQAAAGQEQKVLWRQVKIGNYTVVWPSAQGAVDTYLKNDGSGNLSWATISAGGYWTQVAGTYHYVKPTTSADSVVLYDGSTTYPALTFAGVLSGCAECGFSASSTVITLTQKGYLTQRGYIDFQKFTITSGNYGAGMVFRRGDNNTGGAYTNHIESRTLDGVSFIPLSFANTAGIFVPPGDASMPAVAVDVIGYPGFYYVTSPQQTFRFKSKYGSYYPTAEFGGAADADGGVRFMRGDTATSYQNWIRSYLSNGTTVTALRLQASKVQISVGASGDQVMTLPTAKPTSNGQCLVGNTDGTTSWGDCAMPTTTTSTSTSTSSTSSTVTSTTTSTSTSTVTSSTTTTT